jgi:hypothetical protein
VRSLSFSLHSLFLREKHEQVADQDGAHSVHDSTWKECPEGHAPSDFARQIRDAFEELNREKLEAVEV